MTTKSVSQEIIDEFIAELSKSKILDQPKLDSLKSLLSSGKFKKEDIANFLREGEENENP